MEIDLKGKEIDVNVENKDFFKKVIRASSEISEMTLSAEKSEKDKPGKKKKSASSLAQVKTIAEALSSKGITVKLSYKSHIVVTLGAGAHPRLSQLITRTHALAINSLLRLIEMIM